MFQGCSATGSPIATFTREALSKHEVCSVMDLLPVGDGTHAIVVLARSARIGFVAVLAAPLRDRKPGSSTKV